MSICEEKFVARYLKSHLKLTAGLTWMVPAMELERDPLCHRHPVVISLWHLHPCVTSLCHFTVSLHCVTSLCHVTVSRHCVTSLCHFTVSLMPLCRCISLLCHFSLLSQMNKRKVHEIFLGCYAVLWAIVIASSVSFSWFDVKDQQRGVRDIFCYYGEFMPFHL